MNFTVSTLAKSLAAYLAPQFPGVQFYEGPNQQGTRPPCMFLQQRYSYIELRQAGRYLRRIGLDLTYLVDYNLPELQALYEAASEMLDQMLETFPYTDGVTTAPLPADAPPGTQPEILYTLLRTYDRESRIDLDALHYKFELKVWVERPGDEVKMREMALDQEVTDGTESP